MIYILETIFDFVSCSTSFLHYGVDIHGESKGDTDILSDGSSIQNLDTMRIGILGVFSRHINTNLCVRKTNFMSYQYLVPPFNKDT